MAATEAASVLAMVAPNRATSAPVQPFDARSSAHKQKGIMSMVLMMTMTKAMYKTPTSICQGRDRIVRAAVSGSQGAQTQLRVSQKCVLLLP